MTGPSASILLNLGNLTDRFLLRSQERRLSGIFYSRDPEDRLTGSLAVTLMLLQKGASVVRTHDVAQTLDVIRVFERMVKHS